MSSPENTALGDDASTVAATEQPTDMESVAVEDRAEPFDRTPTIDRAMWRRLRTKETAREEFRELGQSLTTAVDEGDEDTLEVYEDGWNELVKLWEDRDWYKLKYKEYRKKCHSLRSRYEYVVDKHNYLVAVSRKLRACLENREEESSVEQALTIDKEALYPVEDLTNLGAAPFYGYEEGAGPDDEPVRVPRPTA